MTKPPVYVSDLDIEHIARNASVPASNMDAFAKSLRSDFEIYARDKARPNANKLHDEVKGLYDAAKARDASLLAQQLAALADETRALLQARADRLGVPFPSDVVASNEAFDNIQTVCRMGGKFIAGRSRGGGKRSWSWATLLYAPEKATHSPKREAERAFVTNLRLTWLVGTGAPPALSACRERPGPFVRFVKDCLIMAGAWDVDVIKTINSTAEELKAASRHDIK